MIRGIYVLVLLILFKKLQTQLYITVTYSCNDEKHLTLITIELPTKYLKNIYKYIYSIYI